MRHRPLDPKAQGCMCHSEKVDFSGLSRTQRRSALMQDVGQKACPLRTMRAPACAAGEHMAILRELLGSVHTALLLDPCVARLAPESRDIVMRDFARGRQHVNLFLSARLSFWQALPWKLFGISHPDAAVAAECAGESLALYERSGDDAWHHWLTVQLCTPGLHLETISPCRFRSALLLVGDPL